MNRPSFLDTAIALRDRVAPVADLFGLPGVRSLVVRQKSGNGYAYTEIIPKPKIDDEQIGGESPERIGSASLATRVFQVQGISRAYGEQQIIGAGIDYFVDGRMVNGRLVGGILCDYVAHDELTLVWNLTLKQRIGGKQVSFN